MTRGIPIPRQKHPLSEIQRCTLIVGHRIVSGEANSGGASQNKELEKDGIYFEQLGVPTPLEAPNKVEPPPI